jgi:hypothetical protein
MEYTAWDGVSYGEGEPIVPFTKIYESENIIDVINFIDDNDKYDIIFVCGTDGKIMFDTTMKIYESPDGKQIFERNIYSKKRKLIK